MRTPGYYLTSPDEYDGQLFSLGTAKIYDVLFDGIVMRLGGKKSGFDLKIHTDTPRIIEQFSKGDQVTVQGTFHRDGTATLVDYHIHSGRNLKIYISLIPISLICLLLIRTYTVSYTNRTFHIVLKSQNKDA